MTPSQSELRQRHYALYRSILPDMIDRLRWDRAQIDAFQADALRKVLHHAKAHSPFHAARLAHIDLSVPHIALQQIPTMGKAELMAHWDDIVTTPGATRAQAEEHLRTTMDAQYLWGDTVLLASGGTGGSPGLFVYDFSGFAVNWASMSRSMMAQIVPQLDTSRAFRVASIGAGMSAHGSYVMGRIFSDPGNETTTFPLWETPSRIFPALSALDPHFIFCTSGYALQLLAGHREGSLRIDPQIIFFSSEQLTQTAYAQVRQAWPNTHVFTCWGTTEAAGTFPCTVTGGFHISEDGVVIEPIDEHGEPSQPGAWSHAILLTNLYNMALPLIRYRIDDVFEFADAPCACGVAFRKVAQVHGRNTERFRYGDVSIHANLVELAILEQPIIQEYQIAQTRDGVHIRYSAATAADETRIADRVARDLTEYGLAAPDVRIERVARITRSQAGKLQRFVPLTT